MYNKSRRTTHICPHCFLKRCFQQELGNNLLKLGQPVAVIFFILNQEVQFLQIKGNIINETKEKIGNKYHIKKMNNFNLI